MEKNEYGAVLKMVSKPDYLEGSWTTTRMYFGSVLYPSRLQVSEARTRSIQLQWTCQVR